MTNKNKKARARYRAKQKAKRYPKNKERKEKQEKELERLLANVHPKAKPPLTFGWWSTSFQIMWLRDHQRKTK